MDIIDLGLLEHGPHALLIRDMATRCIADTRIQAIWVGGSLASGRGDTYSDIDFRIAVEPGQLTQWSHPDWSAYLPIPVCGEHIMHFGETALLHHMVLADGTIVDFFVQDTTRHNPEPNVVILACRDPQFRALLEGFVHPAAALTRDIDGVVVRQFIVEYWITTHKQLKALARKYDLTAFAGLYIERLSLLRVWYMQTVGRDIDARLTLHMIGALHAGLADKLTAEQHAIMGLPSQTPAQTIAVIESIRDEMARVGQLLAARHAFSYPHELEAVVRRSWSEHKQTNIQR